MIEVIKEVFAFATGAILALFAAILVGYTAFALLSLATGHDPRQISKDRVAECLKQSGTVILDSSARFDGCIIGPSTIVLKK